MSGSALEGVNPITKTVREPLVPAEAGGMEAIQCLVYYKYVAFQFSKLGASNDIGALKTLGFQISIANVGGPQFKAVELGKKDDCAESM